MQSQTSELRRLDGGCAPPDIGTEAELECLPTLASSGFGSPTGPCSWSPALLQPAAFTAKSCVVGMEGCTCASAGGCCLQR
mmetsp:Transcript_50637/g.113715  ORF Transcript_50637/g.113715 Transcript_50637/m.113715 type:complete len:81 (-) Transcript_50637:20-262(-)